MPQPQKPRIVIEMEGGAIRFVYSDADVEVVIADWDNKQVDEDDEYCHWVRTLPVNPLGQLPNGIITEFMFDAGSGR